MGRRAAACVLQWVFWTLAGRGVAAEAEEPVELPAVVVAQRSAERSAALGGGPRGTVPPPQISDYVVILDAGSTATRAQAFHYKPRVLTPKEHDFVESKPLSLPEPLFYFSRSPGLSSFSEEPAGLYTYMRALADEVAVELKHHDAQVTLREVPVYLGATAGMRELAPQQREKVLEPIRNALRDSPLFFGVSSQARVLSGEEEGAWGWLMVNYFHGEISSSPTKTFGSLDLGGDSAEITFIPEDPSIMSNLFPMHFGQFPGAIHLYTHSFTRFGLVAAFQRASTLLLASFAGAAAEGLRAGGTAALCHPCLPRGFQWQVQAGEFGVATNGDPQRRHGPLLLTGRGDFGGCTAAAESVVADAQAPCTLPPCSLLGVYEPDIGQAHFWLVGEFANIWRLLTPPDNQEPALVALSRAAKEFCGKGLAEQTQQLSLKPGVSTAEPVLACWVAIWSYTFLVKGLHFDPSAVNLWVETGAGRDWPQGAAIYHVNFYPYRVLLGKTAIAYKLERLAHHEKHLKHKLHKAEKHEKYATKRSEHREKTEKQLKLREQKLKHKLSKEKRKAKKLVKKVHYQKHKFMLSQLLGISSLATPSAVIYLELAASLGFMVVLGVAAASWWRRRGAQQPARTPLLEA